MFIDLQIVNRIYNNDDIHRFDLKGLPLVNTEHNEVSNSKWETIQERLNVSNLIETLIPKSVKAITAIKKIGKATSSFNKRAENLSFSKTGILTSKYYTGNYDSTDINYNDFEILIRNNSVMYDPVDQYTERVKAEKEFESILAKFLFISMYKMHSNSSKTWQAKINEYNDTHLDKYKYKNDPTNINDYFNEFIAAELTEALVTLTGNGTQYAQNVSSVISESEIFRNLFPQVTDDVDDIGKKIKNQKSVILNPLKVQFAIYENIEENNTSSKKYLINFIDDIYTQKNNSKDGIIDKLNEKINEFIIMRVDMKFSKNYIEHVFHREDDSAFSDWTVDDYKYPLNRSTLFPEYMTINLQLKNNRKFTLNEWIKHYSDMKNKK